MSDHMHVPTTTTTTYNYYPSPPAGTADYMRMAGFGFPSYVGNSGPNYYNGPTYINNYYQGPTYVAPWGGGDSGFWAGLWAMVMQNNVNVNSLIAAALTADYGYGDGSTHPGNGAGAPGANGDDKKAEDDGKPTKGVEDEEDREYLNLYTQAMGGGEINKLVDAHEQYQMFLKWHDLWEKKTGERDDKKEDLKPLEDRKGRVDAKLAEVNEQIAALEADGVSPEEEAAHSGLLEKRNKLESKASNLETRINDLKSEISTLDHEIDYIENVLNWLAHYIPQKVKNVAEDDSHAGAAWAAYVTADITDKVPVPFQIDWHHGDGTPGDAPHWEFDFEGHHENRNKHRPEGLRDIGF